MRRGRAVGFVVGLALAGGGVRRAHADGPPTDGLVRALGGGDAGARRRALDELARWPAADVAAGARALLPALEDVLRRRDGAERAGVARTLLRVPGARAEDLWVRLLRDADAEEDRVLEAAVASAADRGADPGFGRRLVDLARDDEASEATRALALEALGAVEGPVADVRLRTARPGAGWVEEAGRALGLARRGGPDVVARLVPFLAHPHAAVRTHAWEGLVRHTRADLPPDPAAWRRPPAVAAPPADPYAPPPRGFVPTYYGTPVRGKAWGANAVFCLDVSASMSEHGIEPARRHLKATLLTLTTQDRFDVVAFHEQVVPFAGRPVRAHPVVQARAVAWLDAIVPRSFTNLYDAVETAFSYAGRGRHPADDPVRLDLVFVLSDGAPNRGRYHLPAQVVAGIAALAGGTVPVHTVGAGEQVMPLLRAIAAATGGTCTEAVD